MQPQVFVVASVEDAEGLLYELISECVFNERPVGFDTETTGCNPQKESPVGRAKLWCATFAWGEPAEKTPSPFRRAFVPREFVYVLKPFLEDERYKKVGTNLFGYDRHVCANEGIELRGIEACTSAQSRLLDPGKDAGHGLKAWGERLGYVTTEFKDVATVAIPGKEYKLRTSIKWGQKRLDKLWAEHPGKRKAIVEYACQDAAMSLDVYWHLRGQMQGVRW